MSVPTAEKLDTSSSLEAFQGYPNLGSDVQEFADLNKRWSEAMSGECLDKLPDGYDTVVPVADLAAYDVSVNMALVLKEYGVDTKLIKSDQSSGNSISQVSVALPKEAVSLWNAITAPNLGDKKYTEEPLYPYRVARAISNGGDNEVASMSFTGDRYQVSMAMAFPNEYTLWATHYFRNIELVPMQAMLVAAAKSPDKVQDQNKPHYEFLSEIYADEDRKRTWGETVYNLCNLALLARLADNPELIQEYGLSPNPTAVHSAHDVVHLSQEKREEAVTIYAGDMAGEGEAILKALSFGVASRRR